MRKFKYRAINRGKEEVTGSLESENLTEARATLAGQDLQIVHIEEQRGLFTREIGSGRVPAVEVMHLSRQLSAFIRAGVPILEGIETIAEESGNASLRHALYKVADDLRSGGALSVAFGSHPRIFPRYYIDMLRAAELTGRLDQVLSQLANYLEREVEAKQKIRSAMIYPGLILIMSIFTVLVMTVFVMPRFTAFFKSLNARLPLPTRILLSATGFVAKWWWLLLIGMGALFLVIYLSSKTPSGRALLHRFILRVPAIGPTIKYIIIERFCRILAAMVQAGVPLPEAMTVVGEGTNNAVFESKIRDVRESMIEGEGLARPIARSKIFPMTLVQMIRVGEQTGTLDEQLETAAQFYELELSYKIKRLTALFEPGVILIAGAFVGFVAVAIVSAMYGIFRQVRIFG